MGFWEDSMGMAGYGSDWGQGGAGAFAQDWQDPEQLGMPAEGMPMFGQQFGMGQGDGMTDWQRYNWLNGIDPMTANQAGAFGGNGFGGGLGGGMNNPFGGGRGGGGQGMFGPNLRAGYGGGFGGGQNTDALLSAYMQSQNAARAANLQRYNSILGYYNKGIQGTKDLLSQYSNQDKKDINNQYNAFQGRNTQDMMTKGLGNTTVGTQVARGIETDRSGALARANDMNLNRSLQWLVPEQQAGMSFMERRNDF